MTTQMMQSNSQAGKTINTAQSTLIRPTISKEPDLGAISRSTKPSVNPNRSSVNVTRTTGGLSQSASNPMLGNVNQSVKFSRNSTGISLAAQSTIGSTRQKQKKDDSLFDGSANIVIPQTGVKVRFFQMDPVFDLSAPHAYSDSKQKKPEKPVEKCVCCLAENPKKCTQCEFCAVWSCSSCVNKTFPFPKNKPGIETKFGLICFSCEAKLHIHQVTQQIVVQLQAKDAAFSQKETEIDRTTRQKAQISRDLESKKFKLQDLKKDNEEKLQIWQVKADHEYEKLSKQKAMNETVNFRLQKRKEELISKNDLADSLRRQVEIMMIKMKQAEVDLEQRQEDLGVLNKQIRLANRKRMQPTQRSKDQRGESFQQDSDGDAQSFIGLNYRQVRATSEISGNDISDHYSACDVRESAMRDTSGEHLQSLRRSILTKKQAPVQKGVLGNKEDSKACCETSCNLF